MRAALLIAVFGLAACGASYPAVDGTTGSGNASSTTGPGATASTTGAVSTTGGQGSTATSISGGSSGASTSSGGSTGIACTPDTWSNYAQGFFSAECVRCHSFMSNHTAVRASRTSIDTKIESQAMPPDAGIDADDRARIGTWLDCGAP